MAIATSRAEFERLIELRMKEARFLIDQIGDYDGAYYLAGYAVEFAFKICIIKQVMESDAFPEKELARKYFTHDLEELSRVDNFWELWVGYPRPSDRPQCTELPGCGVTS